MNAFYWREATQLHGTTAPSSGRKLKCPNTGTEGNRGWGGLVRIQHLWGEALIRNLVHLSGKKDKQKGSGDLSQISACAHRGGLTQLTRPRGQINTSNTAQSCLQRSTGTDQYLQTLQKQGLILNMVRIPKHMALLTELFTQVNKTFGTKYMYRNAKWNKTAIFFFSYH